MRFRNRSGELFFLLLACLAQVVTVLACTLWREVVFVPERWKGPPLTQEYLVWYLDEYVPPIDYEGQLFSLYFPFAPLLGLLLVVGLVWLFFRFYRKGPGQKKVFFPLVAAGFLGILGFSLWLRQYGQPYYLWMDGSVFLSWQALLWDPRQRLAQKVALPCRPKILAQTVLQKTSPHRRFQMEGGCVS
ncbi:MAG: hypothetical protein ACLR6W_03655 [Evtepia sp.]